MWTCFILFIHISYDGRFSCNHLFTMVNEVMNVTCQGFGHVFLCLTVLCFLIEVEVLGHMVHYYIRIPEAGYLQTGLSGSQDWMPAVQTAWCQPPGILRAWQTKRERARHIAKGPKHMGWPRFITTLTGTHSKSPGLVINRWCPQQFHDLLLGPTT